jgi:hypothetical protein
MLDRIKGCSTRLAGKSCRVISGLAYSVLTDSRDDAMAWVDPALARLMMAWPESATSPEVPFMLLLLLRGKAYLRMEYTPAELSTLQHAALIFTSACESALDGPFRTLE